MLAEEGGIGYQQEGLHRRLERELAQAQAHNEELRESIEALQEQIRSCSLSSSSLTSELDASNAKIADLEEFITNVEREIQDKRDQLGR